MDPAFHIAVSQCVQEGEEKEQKKTTSLREEHDILEDGLWNLRSILLDSDELTDSMNNKFVMAAAQKWLRDLLLMLDLALLDSVNEMVVKDYRQSYMRLRSHVMSIRRVRGSQRQSRHPMSAELKRRLDVFDDLMFSL